MVIIIRIQILLLCVGILATAKYGWSSEKDVTPPALIAHAGGAVNQRTYTNSLEALEVNYQKGFRFFEIDFSWTTDGELVAIHDWDRSFKGNFIVTDNKVPTEAEFLQLKMKSGLTQLSLKGVLIWARDKGDAYIVTDVKDKNTEALRKIIQGHKEFQKHIIPQVYSFQEYGEVYELGYRDIILTLYRMKPDPHGVIAFSKQRSPFAITMHWQVAQAGLAYYLHENKTPVYAHTVNDVELYKSLKKIGVHGIYTDFIVPSKVKSEK